MATYAIGDIHGCFSEFQRLLEKIGFDESTDQICHVGDLVNGGPDSLATVRWFVEHQDVAETVLGNHDLHMIAVALGAQEKSDRDTFDDILDAPDCADIIDWLCRRPLLMCRQNRVIVHAGLLPQWTADQARDVAREVEELLAGAHPERVLETMYGNRPARWEDVRSAEERWRVTINAMTRMRVLKPDGEFDFSYKSVYEEIPPDHYAWFDAPHAAWADHQLLCGHWSALGFRHTDRIVALDTGCRWGGKLSAFRLEDDRLFQVDSTVRSA